ncbi:MAG: hypothetical protein KGI75_20000 [Rhizobiaceae bacterium]|nr:hypothetical protein [Rhizobiaceae bacterium]
MPDPALPADVPILDGWNVWDVLQATAPIDPTPGTPNDQLATFVRDAVGVPDLPLALTSSVAAGERVATRAVIPELAGEPLLGVAGSGVLKRTIAFEMPGGKGSIAWPHDDNLLLDAVYDAAPAPAQASTPVASSGNTAVPAAATPLRAQEASLWPLAFVAAAVFGVVFARKRGS